MDGREARLADLSYEIARAEDMQDLRELVTREMRAVISADLMSYTEVSLRTGETMALVDVPSVEIVAGADRLGELAHEHPLIMCHSDRAQAISDHLSAPAFKRLALYHDVFRPLDAADQLTVTVHHDAEVIVGLALNRSRRGFSATDRRMLDALGAVVRRSRGRLLARSRGRELLAERERDGMGGPVGVIAISADGETAFADDRARAWLGDYFPRDRSPGRSPSLPARLSASAAAADHPLEVKRGNGVLLVSALPSRTGEPRLLELRERRDPVHLPLTARERVVLDRVALGESNAEIAAALVLSRRTVENHLRAIYRKLGVSSRTAALARARR